MKYLGIACFLAVGVSLAAAATAASADGPCTRPGLFASSENTAAYYGCFANKYGGLTKKSFSCAEGQVFVPGKGCCTQALYRLAAESEAVTNSPDVESPTIPTFPTEAPKSTKGDKEDIDDDTTQGTEVETTESHSTTPAPEVTAEETTAAEPEVTTEEASTAQPEVTPEETTTAVPEVTPEETTASEPEVTPEETTAAEPETTPEDSTTASPEEPEVTPEPTTPGEPEVTTQDSESETTTEEVPEDTTTPDDAETTPEDDQTTTEESETTTEDAETTTATDGETTTPKPSDFNCPTNGFFPQDGSCDKFNICAQIDGEILAFLMNCPAGQNFDPVSGYCTTFYNCQSLARHNRHTNFDCQVEGTFVHQDDCARYFKCTWEHSTQSFRAQSLQCPHGQVFHILSGMCDVEDALTCLGRPGNSRFRF